jgi:DNA modification methylase
MTECTCPDCGHEFDAKVEGGHRLLCGDATIAADVDRVLAGAKPHLMVTDPPYGVEYDANWRNEAGRSIDGTTQRIKTGRVVKPIGARAIGKVSNDDRADWREAWALFPGDVAYVWHGSSHTGEVQHSLEAAGFVIRWQIVWNKGRLVIGRGDYHSAHEPCWYAVRKGAKSHWTGSRSESTVWELRHLKSETGHSTQKPVDAMRRPMINNSEAGDAVYDPFVGSGTSLIAAETIGRRCYAIELDPLYVDVSVRRWQQFANGVARLETGESFDEVAEARVGPAAA